MGNNEKTLEHFRKLKYDIVTRRLKGKFILFIRELSLFGEDESLEKAYEKLELVKDQYFQKLIEMGAQNDITEPDRSKAKNTFFGNIASFAVKFIVIVITVIVLLKTINHFSSTFKYFQRASKEISKMDIQKLSNDISQATKDISETMNIVKVEQMILNIMDTFENHQKAKEERTQKAKKERALISKFNPITPVYYHSSNSMELFPVKFAFDSNPNTFWHSFANVADIFVRFERPSILEALIITIRNDVPAVQGPDSFVLEGSSDNKNWKLIDEVTQLVWDQGERKVIVVENKHRAYKYYKLVFTNDDYVSISGMELFGNSSVEALDTGQMVKEEKVLFSDRKALTPADLYASSSSDSCPVEFAFDSNSSTYWQSNRSVASIIVKFKYSLVLKALSISLSNNILDRRQYPDKFTIEGSNDNKNWKLIDEVPQLIWKQGETQGITLNNNKPYIYYRLKFEKYEKIDSSICIVEVKLYGDKIVDFRNFSTNEAEASVGK